MPCRGHLERAKRIFNYLSNYKDASITFDVEVPEHSQFKIEQPEWKYIYGECKEQIPENAPEPKGKSVTTTSFIDANAATGMLHMLNKIGSVKRQSQVKTAT